MFNLFSLNSFNDSQGQLLLIFIQPLLFILKRNSMNWIHYCSHSLHLLTSLTHQSKPHHSPSIFLCTPATSTRHPWSSLCGNSLPSKTGIFDMQWQSCSCAVWDCELLCLTPPASNSLFSHLPCYACLWSSRNIHTTSALHAVFAAAVFHGPNIPLCQPGFTISSTCLRTYPTSMYILPGYSLGMVWSQLVLLLTSCLVTFCSKTGTSGRWLQGICTKRLFLQYCCTKLCISACKRIGGMSTEWFVHILVL